MNKIWIFYDYEADVFAFFTSKAQAENFVTDLIKLLEQETDDGNYEIGEDYALIEYAGFNPLATDVWNDKSNTNIYGFNIPGFGFRP